MSRTFNITADCKPSLHYMVDITDRLEKIKKITGLDLREFDHAIVFKVAMMVKKYLDTQNTSKY